jgi:hypothetical protein
MSIFARATLAILAGTWLATAGALDREPTLSAEELQTFSQSALGGKVEMFTHNGKEIAVVTRSFTSGVRSSDLGVYAKRDAGYVRVLYREPIWMNHLAVTQDGDTITIRTEPAKRPLLTFTISGSFLPSR